MQSVVRVHVEGCKVVKGHLLPILRQVDFRVVSTVQEIKGAHTRNVENYQKTRTPENQ